MIDSELGSTKFST